MPTQVAARRLLEKLNTEEEAGAKAPLIDCPDPVVFAREWLGVEPWSRQEELLHLAAEHPRVAVRSGHKVGKSISAAILALWWFLTRPRALVVMTSSSDDQIRLILWPELRRVYRSALRPLGGRLYDAHRTGLLADDGRRIVGKATDRTENMGGFSGDQLLFIADESSGIAQGIFTAIEGNRAGGARVVLLGNPTQTSGEFFDAFHDKAEFYRTLHISSEEAVEYQEAVRPIPGLAMRAWLEEKRKEWNGPPRGASPEQVEKWETAPEWDVRVGGDFPRESQSSVIGLRLVELAVKRFDALAAAEEGPLELGLDVARFGDDESVVAPRRGRRILPLVVLRSMDGHEVAGHVLELVRALRKPGERPRVKVDVIGYGSSAYDVLARSNEVQAIPVNVAEEATIEPSDADPGYTNLRAQLTFGVRDFLREGGALPSDARLKSELVASQYGFDNQGRKKVEPKLEMKKRLGRSPDRADAVALAIFNPPALPFAGTIDEVSWMRG